MEIDLKLLLPHRRKMILVDRLKDYNVERRTIVIESDINEEKLCLSSGGSVSTMWYVEFMSQGAAILYQLLKQELQEEVKIGFLIMIKDLRIHEQQLLKKGDVLTISSQLVEELHPFGYFSCELHSSGKKIAHAELSFVTDPKVALNENIKMG